VKHIPVGPPSETSKGNESASEMRTEYCRLER